MRKQHLLLSFALAACGGSQKASTGGDEAPPPPPPAKNRPVRSDGPPGQVELEAAVKAAKDGNLDAAIDRAQAAFGKNPQLETAYLLYGSACAMKEDETCEIDAYQKGLAALPRSAALKKAMGLVHLQKNEMDRAIALLEEANQISGGKDTEVMADLAYAYIFVQRIDDGEQLATKALAIDPKCFQCNMALGQIHLTKKKYDQAIQAYGRATELVPEDPAPRRKIAQATYLAGKQKEALDLYAGEVERNADDDDLRFEYAKGLLGAKRPKEAAVQIQKLLEKNADEPNLLKLLLKAQQQAQDKKGAQATQARLKKLGVKP